MDSCIPKKSAPGIFYSQLIRFARINSCYQAFKIKCKNLAEILVRQGYKLADLRRLCLRFFKHKNSMLLHFNIDNVNIFHRDILQ